MSASDSPSPPPDSRHSSPLTASDAPQTWGGSGGESEERPAHKATGIVAGNPGDLSPLLAVLTCVALAGGGLLGWETRRHSFSTSGSNEEREAAARVTGTNPAESGQAGDSASLLTRAAARLRAEIKVPLLTENPSVDQIRVALEKGTAPLSETRGLAERWARMDPAGFWRWFKDRGIEFDKFSATSVIFEEWVRRDPDAAFRAAGLCNDFQKRQDAMAGLLQALPGADATLREKYGANLSLLGRYAIGFAGMEQTGGAGTGSVGRIVAALLEFPAGESRDQVLVNAAGSWFDTDWKASTQWAESVPEPLRSRLKAQMASKALFAMGKAESFAWGEKWLMTEASQADRQQAGPVWVKSVSKQDPARALEWAQENLAGRALGEGMREVIGAQVAKDPAAARALVEGLPPGGLRDQVAAAAMGKYSVESARWLAGILDPERGSWMDIGSNWARQDPAGLKQFISEQGGDPEKSKLLMYGITGMTARDPQATLDWTLTLPPGNTSLALGYWASNDPKAASAWLTAHSSSPLEAGGVEKVSAALMRQSPQAAVDWAANFPAGGNREDVLKIVREQLREATGLSAEEAAALNARLAGGG
jgi:hypothetical protein